MARSRRVADAFEDFTILIHLPQLALRIRLVAAMDHQIVDHEADARPDAEAVFGKSGSKHRKYPLSSYASPQYMQRFLGMQPIALFSRGFHETKGHRLAARLTVNGLN